jgi:glycosyltransferase involved in cell wall biosynthesis
VHPSAVEVLSATVLEALAAGLPVLGGPAVEGVFDDGASGWVIPDSDPAAFVSALRAYATRLVGDDALRRTLGDRARGIAQTRYAWPRIVEEHLRIYASSRSPGSASSPP